MRMQRVERLAHQKEPLVLSRFHDAAFGEKIRSAERIGVVAKDADEIGEQAASRRWYVFLVPSARLRTLIRRREFDWPGETGFVGLINAWVTS